MIPTADPPTILRFFALLYPWQASASEDLSRSLAYLEAEAPPELVVRAGYGLALVVGPVVAVPTALVGVPVTLTTAVALAVAVGAATAVHTVPVTLATMRRTGALGEAPELVGRAVMRMRVAPSVERSAAFAAERGDDPLADSLAEHVRRARGTPDSGLAGFAAEWADWFPALRRAALLVESAADAPAGERSRTLDRAMDAVLDGTRDRMAAFADDVQGPATGIYAFGVLLPLALVSVLPAARAAGLPATVPAIVVGYDLALPAVLLWATWRLLAKRPVAFRPPRIPSDHPEVRDRRWPALAIGTGAATLGWTVVTRADIGWAAPLAAAGWGAGSALLWRFRPEKRVRDRVRALEATLPDALYLVGRRVERGTAVEAAVAAAADEVDDPTGSVLSETARRGRQLRIGLRDAFLGECGPLATLPSTRARTSAAMLALAGREGGPAGSAAVATADHMDELTTVEGEARRSLARITDTLGSTAVAFGPLVGGATVALADGMATVDGAVAPVPVATLGLAVGAYVVVLSVILTVLSVGLARGLDRALLGYRSGVSLVAAPTVFLVAYGLAGAVV